MGTQGEGLQDHSPTWIISFHSSKIQWVLFQTIWLGHATEKEELKKQGKVEAEVSEVTGEDVAKAFGVTKDHMLEAEKILQAEETTENSGKLFSMTT